MRKALALLVLGFVALIWSATAEAATYPCKGAPLSYRQAFDTVRGQAADNEVHYPERRFYFEYQSWLTPVGEQPGHHSEHIHIGACWPVGIAWKVKPRFIDQVTIFHHLQGYRMHSWAAQLNYCDSVGSCDSNAHDTFELVTAAEQAEDIPALNAAMAASGSSTQTVYHSWQAKDPPQNGPMEVRWFMNVERNDSTALVELWQLEARVYFKFADAGLPTGTIWSTELAYRSRTIINWIQDGTLHSQYHHSGACTDSYGWTVDKLVALPTKPTWNYCVRSSDGRGHAVLMVDPDFHNHYAAPTASCPNVDALGNCLGIWFEKFYIWPAPQQPWTSVRSIPTGSLGIKQGQWGHRLVFLSHDDPDCLDLETGGNCPPGTRPVWSNVMVLNFKGP